MLSAFTKLAMSSESLPPDQQLRSRTGLPLPSSRRDRRRGYGCRGKQRHGFDDGFRRRHRGRPAVARFQCGIEQQPQLKRQGGAQFWVRADGLAECRSPRTHGNLLGAKIAQFNLCSLGRFQCRQNAEFRRRRDPAGQMSAAERSLAFWPQIPINSRDSVDRPGAERTAAAGLEPVSAGPAGPASRVPAFRAFEPFRRARRAWRRSDGLQQRKGIPCRYTSTSILRARTSARSRSRN